MRLRPTDESGPYRLFNQDLYPHSCESMTNLYGSVPYLTGHSVDGDASVVWMNSAETWVDILDEKDYVSFLSESGTLEFFVFATQ